MARTRCPRRSRNARRRTHVKQIVGHILRNLNIKRAQLDPRDYKLKQRTMATYSKASFKSLNYNTFRPHYPASFYGILGDYLKSRGNSVPVRNALDLGCGTGVATYPLLNLSENVVGLDLSPVMVKTAEELKNERLKELDIGNSDRIRFRTGSVESQIYSGLYEIKEGSVDLITAAQCIHWFKDYDIFFKAAAKLLKPGGVIAYWYYVDPVITSFSGPSSVDKETALKNAYDIYHKYVYDDPEYIGQHWENPGRQIIKEFYVDVDKHIPEQLYDYKLINKLELKPGALKDPSENQDLVLRRESIKLKDLEGYLLTYSGYHNYKEATNDEKDFTGSYFAELEKVNGWNRDETTIDLVWNTGYTFITKR